MPRKHKGIIQKGGNKGKLKKGYKFTGKRTKTGLPIIKKVRKVKYKKKQYGGREPFSPLFAKDNLIELLDVCKKLVESCDKNNIEYIPFGGTFIGAIRHKGFIPWDTDIDFVFNIKDIDKFKDVNKDLSIFGLDVRKEIFFNKQYITVYKKDKEYDLSMCEYRVDKIQDKIILPNLNKDGKDKEILTKYVYPLKKEKFNNFYINMPSDKIRYHNNININKRYYLSSYTLKCESYDKMLKYGKDMISKIVKPIEEIEILKKYDPLNVGTLYE
jgi:phosphorylcholine metabolism protein LicD